MKTKIRNFIHMLRNTYLPTLFDKSFTKGIGWQVTWLIVVALITILLVLGIGRIVYQVPSFDNSCETVCENDYAYSPFKFLMLMLDAGTGTDPSFAGIHWFAFITAVVGLVVLNGMVISVISNILQRRMERYTFGHITYKRMSGHIVVMGYDDSVPALLDKLIEEDEDRTILVLTAKEIPDVRSKLHVALSQGHDFDNDARINPMIRIVLYHGEINSEADIARLHLDTAQKIYIVGNAESEAHDSLNIDCLSKLAAVRQKSGGEGRIPCYIQFDQPEIFAAFRHTDIDKLIKRQFDYIPYCKHEVWAQKVLLNGASIDGMCYWEKPDTKEMEPHPNLIEYEPIDTKDGIQRDSQKHVHIIVIGMSRMGRAFATQAALIAHYPNFVEGDARTRTHITFIDADMRKKMHEFQNQHKALFQLACWRYVETDELKYNITEGWIDPMTTDSPYRHLGDNFIDSQWEFVEGTAEMPSIANYLKDSASDPAAICTVVLCTDNQEDNLVDALYLPEEVCMHANQILVYQPDNSAIALNLSKSLEDKQKRLQRLHPFGMDAALFGDELVPTEHGKRINAWYNKIPLSDTEAIEQKWRDTSLASRWSSIYNTNMRDTRKRSIGCPPNVVGERLRSVIEEHLDEMVLTEHNRWVTERLLTGFRPVTLQEYEQIEQGKITKNELKGQPLMAHLDICSNERLRIIDAGTVEHDKDVLLALPDIQNS